MGTTLMQKTGQIERTVDREFAEEESKYRVCVAFLSPCAFVLSLTGSFRMEKETGTLQKEAKSYLDAMRGAVFVH